MEARLVPNAGFPIEWVEIGGFNQVGLLRRLRTLWQLPLSVFKVFRFLGRIRPGAYSAWEAMSPGRSCSQRSCVVSR